MRPTSDMIAAVEAQVETQVRARVLAQVGARVWAQVRAQVGAQVWAQVVARVWARVGAQVRAQVRAQVGAQVRAQVGEQVREQIRDHFSGNGRPHRGGRHRRTTPNTTSPKLKKRHLPAAALARETQRAADRVRNLSRKHIGVRIRDIQAKMEEQIHGQTSTNVSDSSITGVWRPCRRVVYDTVGALIIERAVELLQGWDFK